MATLTVKELFDFAVDPAINEGNLDAALDALMEVASRWGQLAVPWQYPGSTVWQYHDSTISLVLVVQIGAFCRQLVRFRVWRRG